MRHITVCVTDEIYHHARLCAARRDLSVSALVRKYFESLRESPHNYYKTAIQTLNRVPPPPLFPVKLSNCETVTAVSIKEGADPSQTRPCTVP
jgi:hypothetical protein